MKANKSKEGQGNAKKEGLERDKEKLKKNQPLKIINSAPVQTVPGADPAS